MSKYIDKYYDKKRKRNKEKQQLALIEFYILLIGFLLLMSFFVN